MSGKRPAKAPPPMAPQMLGLPPPRPPEVAATDGAIMVSAGKYARNCVMMAFEMIGGVKRLTEIADEDPKWFYEKLFSKTITREVEETKRTESVEDLLDAIDAEVTPVISAQDAEFEDT